MKYAVLLAGISALVTPLAFAADAAEVDAVVAAVKAANPDLRALCQGAPDSIRKAVSEKTTELVVAGKVKDNPQEVGGEAGKKLGQACRGG